MTTPAAPPDDVWSLRLARLPVLTSILAAVILVPLTLLFLLLAAVTRDLKPAGVGAAMGVICGRLVLEALTVRLRLSRDRLWLDRYWRTQWTAPRACIGLERGRVAEGSVVKGYRVLDRETGALIGVIPFWQFRGADLDRLETLISETRSPPPGAGDRTPPAPGDR